jgi:putative transcriptional regulator
MFLKGRAGLTPPMHGHTGTEVMQLLSDSLSDERRRYGLGDLDEADADVNHQPVVDSQSECICLRRSMAALDCTGRLLQPLAGF